MNSLYAQSQAMIKRLRLSKTSLCREAADLMEQLSNAALSEELISIVGAEDYSDDGRPGVITFDGPIAENIKRAMYPLMYKELSGPVRVSRAGGLEIWFDGYYTEGGGVRKIVHQAVRELGIK